MWVPPKEPAKTPPCSSVPTQPRSTVSLSGSLWQEAGKANGDWGCFLI